MSDTKSEVAVFGGGCFWCTEAVFGELRGVKSVVSGYAGGSVKNPTYEQVCGGRTGHAEVIRIEYDPSQITFKDLLTVFFATHDPLRSTARETTSAPSTARRFSTLMRRRSERLKLLSKSSMTQRPLRIPWSRRRSLWVNSTRPKITIRSTTRIIPTSPTVNI